MTWTAPRTWVTSEVPTAAIFNTHVRDNLLDLHQVGSLFHLAEYSPSANYTLTNSEADVTGWTSGAITTPGSHRYIAIATAQFFTTTLGTAGKDLEAYLNVAGTNRSPNIVIEVESTTADTVSTMAWTGTRSDTSITYKMRAMKDINDGTHAIGSSDSTLVLALFSAV